MSYENIISELEDCEEDVRFAFNMYHNAKILKDERAQHDAWQNVLIAQDRLRDTKIWAEQKEQEEENM